MRVLSISILLVLLAVPAWAGPDDPLAPVAFLVGTWEGDGKHEWGAYRETQVATRALNDTVIEVRTTSTMGERVIHEDRRVISWYEQDGKPVLRMRQWAKGILRTYTGAVDDKGRVTFDEAAREAHPGEAPPRWRYVFTPKAKGGFTYEVFADEGGTWKPFVSGDLGAELKDPGKGGGLGIRQFETKIGEMPAQVHHPDGEGPFPAIVFSPGGQANSFQGYRPYGRFFATWGYITVIVAFNDNKATDRAPKMGKVLDWLTAEHARDGSPLKGMVDTKKLATAGHSRGGFAAIVAARADPRVTACLALAPSGPLQAPEGEGKAPVCVIIGDKDQFQPAANSAYSTAPGERFHLLVPGMGHMLDPREATLKLVRRSTAFLQYALRGDERYRVPLLEEGGGLTIQSAGRK